MFDNVGQSLLSNSKQVRLCLFRQSPVEIGLIAHLQPGMLGEVFCYPAKAGIQAEVVQDGGAQELRKLADVSDGAVEELADGMKAFTKVLQTSTDDYVKAPDTWTASSPQVINVAKQSGAKPDEVPPVLALYQFPLAAEQASNKWLGAGKDGGAAKALAATAVFLKDQKKVPAVLPDYSVAINPSFVQAAE